MCVENIWELYVGIAGTLDKQTFSKNITMHQGLVHHLDYSRFQPKILECT